MNNILYLKGHRTHKPNVSYFKHASTMSRGCFPSLESLPILIETVKHKYFLCNVTLPLVHISALLLCGERWNCPLGSSLSRSDCAYKARRKLGEVNRGQAVLQAVKQLRVWLKTTLSWNINIPAGSLAMHSAPAASRAAMMDRGEPEAGSRWRRGRSFYDLAEMLEMVSV